MFFHFLAGILIFLGFGVTLFGVSIWLLTFGMFIAVLPDIAYWFFLFRNWLETGKLKVDKNSHEHRDSFIHSIFFPFTLIPICFLLNPDMTPAVFLASLSHPLLDAWGIGWGVKLFYPLSNKTFKFFYRGKFVTIFTPEELAKHAEEHGDDDWWRKVYISFNAEDLPSWYGKADWVALFLTLMIIFIV